MLAAGAGPRELRAAYEQELTEKGVNYCAACDGVFFGIGRKPSTELVKGQLEIDPAGYVVAGGRTQTNISGSLLVLIGLMMATGMSGRLLSLLG